MREDAYAHLYAPATTTTIKAPVVGGSHAARHASAAYEKRGDARPKRRRRRIPVPALAALAIVAGLYLMGVAAFSFILYPNTVLAGEDVSLQLASEVASSMATSVANHVIAVSDTDGFSMEVDGSDVSLEFDSTAFAKNLISQQNPWLWLTSIFSSHEIDPVYESTFDEDALSELVSSAVSTYNQSAVASSNATIAYDDTASSYEVVAEKQGTTLDADATTDQVATALQTLDSSVVLTSAAYEHPSITSDDSGLQSAISEANSYLKATQALTIDGTQVASVTKEQIANWITIGSDLSVSINTDAITTWAQGDLSSKLDTVGTTRTYSTPDGSTYTVSGGTYGWNIDGATLATSIASAIEAGSSGSIEVPMKQTGAVWASGSADWGTRWIDIDITTQHAKLYDNGSVIWESDIVTGNSSEGYDTPEGVYAIDSYMTSTSSSGSRVKLISPEVDSSGNPTYTSYVDYWMPFVGNLIALHDASWRSNFGGTIYQTNGSHGCVNLPTDAAATLYSLVSVGDVVVVHS